MRGHYQRPRTRQPYTVSFYVLHMRNLETQTPEYMTVGEVAKLLGVVGETVRWWTRTGRLAALRTRSGVRFFDRRDVEAFAKRRAAERPRRRRVSREVV